MQVWEKASYVMGEPGAVRHVILQGTPLKARPPVLCGGRASPPITAR